jgi:hypothetical protein
MSTCYDSGIAKKTNDKRGESVFCERLPVCTLEELELLNTDVDSVAVRGQLV